MEPLHSDTKLSSGPVCILMRILCTESDETAWSTLFANESIPFGKSLRKGKIVVKIIHRYEDEVLKVYE